MRWYGAQFTSGTLTATTTRTVFDELSILIEFYFYILIFVFFITLFTVCLIRFFHYSISIVRTLVNQNRVKFFQF